MNLSKVTRREKKLHTTKEEKKLHTTKEEIFDKENVCKTIKKADLRHMRIYWEKNPMFAFYMTSIESL